MKKLFKIFPDLIKKIMLVLALTFGICGAAFSADSVDDATIKVIAAHALEGHSCDFPKQKTVEDMETYIKILSLIKEQQVRNCLMAGRYFYQIKR